MPPFDTRLISFRSYYDLLPSHSIECGDIWRGLPTLGLLSKSHTSGIIITPACDLSNNKTLVVTYLPIIPAIEIFVQPFTLSTLKRVVEGQCNSLGIKLELAWRIDGFLPISADEIERSARYISECIDKENKTSKRLRPLRRVAAALSLLLVIAGRGKEAPIRDDVISALDSDWLSVSQRIVTNSHSLDLHFLPRDEQPASVSAIPNHSVVLMRFPITVPVDVLLAAQSTPPELWEETMLHYEFCMPIARSFRDTRPLKTMTLRSEFRSDLLSRYNAIFSRIGSPDFSKMTTQRYTSEF